MKVQRLRSVMLFPICALLMIFVFQNCAKFEPGNLQSDEALLSSNGNPNTPPGGTPDANNTSPAPNPFVTTPGALQGSIFKQNPTHDSQNLNLAFNAILTPYVMQADITNLSSGATALTNGYSSISIDGFYPKQIVKPTDPLIANPSQPAFQQVNAYFHANHLFSTVLKSFPLTGFTPMMIDPHCADPNAASNAFFDTYTHTECLGYVDFGSYKVWASDDADVIVHETGHSLNHHFATDNTLSEHPESGAIDEAMADYWAFSINGDPQIGEWYGGAIYNGQKHFVRDLSTTFSYPDQIIGEVHADSLPISTALYQISQHAPYTDQTHRITLATHLLESLQKPATFNEVVHFLQTELPQNGFPLTDLNPILQERGLLRRDAVTQLMNPHVVIIDNHSVLGPPANGGSVSNQPVNCNGALDPGEVAFVYIDLSNLGPALGGVVATVTTTAPDTELAVQPQPFGYARFNANSTFLQSIPSGFKTSPTAFAGIYVPLIEKASFTVATSSQAHGTYSFQLTLTGMNTLDNQPSTVVVPFTITMGTTPPSNVYPCANGREDSIWP